MIEYNKGVNKDNIESRVEDSLAIYHPVVDFATDPLSMIRSARAGVAMKVIHKLSQQLSLTMKELSIILHVSLRTLQRYGSTKKLNADSSAKVLQLALLQKRGVDVFGDTEVFSEWLHTKVPTLDGNCPIDYLDTPFGFQLIEQSLGRIEHGLFA